MKKHGKRILTLTALIGIAAGIIHIINRVLAATACLKEMLESKYRRVYKWRLGNISYTKRGSGSPVLLIHDMLPGSSGYEWYKVVQSLSENHTVYNIDFPGCGSSDKHLMTYTNFVFVQAISDFVRDIVGEKSDVMVNGFSGSFVVMAAHNNPDLFNKIIMVNPNSPASMNKMPSSKDKALKVVLEIPVFGTLIYHMIVSRETLTNMFIENFFFDLFHLDQELLDAYYEASHKGGCYAKVVYANKLSKYMNVDVSRALQNLNSPVLIIQGEAENSRETILQLYRNENSMIAGKMIEKTKHFPQVENPDEFLKIAEEFL